MIRRVKGMNDMMPDEAPWWHFVESRARQTFSAAQFGEIRTPVLEPLELFKRGVGEETDIVQKEMYTLTDRKERELALRPEGTAAAVRALVEHGLDKSQTVTKLFYLAPMFRYERPQKGRLRQHHQLGAEIFGSSLPAADVDLIATLWDFLNSLGLQSLSLQINSLGDGPSRDKFEKALVNHFKSYSNSLSDDSKRRLQTNPLRILDSKEEVDQKAISDAPEILEFLSDGSRKHFHEVQTLLTQLNVPYAIDTKLVRGLDYYTHTVFEIVAEGLGAKNSVCGGGRYDGLVEQLGGKSTAAVGFGMGLERLIMLLQEQKVTLPSIPLVWLAVMDDTLITTAFKLSRLLRHLNIPCGFEYQSRSLKAQMKRADKQSASHVFLLGSDEINNGKLTIKRLRDGAQVQANFKFGSESFSQSFFEHKAFVTDTCSTTVRLNAFFEVLGVAFEEIN